VSDNYDFPNCMHMLSAAFHRNNINPGAVEITLPRDEWWRLACVFERKFRDTMRYDGRGPEIAEFQYMGFTFKPRS
jgi:hypothetical protein